MKQTITIVIDGADGVLPDSVGNVLRSVFSILKAMDERSWKLQTPRVKWRISEAQLVNPLTISATGEERFAEVGSPDLAKAFVRNLQQIDRGVRPSDLLDEDFKQLKAIAAEAKRSREMKFTGINGDTETISIGNTFARRVAKLIREPIRVRKEYGSIDGTLIQLANDPLKNDGTAKLRDRHTGADVSCHADPDTAAKMARYLNRHSRIVVYGMIDFENDIARRIQVESFAEIPDENDLPSLDDLHALRLRLPNDMSAEDYLDELRGDE